jgi:hypothetical protein
VESAKFLTALAGELWGKRLGRFPWDFEGMIDKVAAYEPAIHFRERDSGLASGNR